MEELKILQKTFDMMNYAYPALAQYPKGEKFALVVDIKRCMDVMLERIIEANKKYYKGYQTVSDGKRQKPACQRIVFFGENGVGFYYCK